LIASGETAQGLARRAVRRPSPEAPDNVQTGFQKSSAASGASVMDIQSYRGNAAQAHRLAKSTLVLKGCVMGLREEAVLKAADNWLRMIEALVAAGKTVEGTEDRQETADLAGVELALAVTRWRSSSDPS
jgi:hypothetical protein